MNNKVMIAVSSALVSMATLTASASMASAMHSVESFKALAPISINKNIQKRSTLQKKFIAEKGLAEGVYTYIVRLKDQPIATYDGSIAGLRATNPRIAKKSLYSALAHSQKSSQQIRQELRINFKAPETIAYINYLDNKQQTFLQKTIKVLGGNVEVVHQYKNAFNGIALRLTQDEAQQLSKLSDVAFVERERIEQLNTDTGPIHIGADQVWNGQGQSAVNMGEGVIIGVLDTGINSDHPSFADIGDDGYDHTNPWGTGVYVGDCAGDYPDMCNDKLIGVRTYSSIVDRYDDTAVFGDNPPPKNGEDYNGHGAHTAGTAGGNILYNVPVLEPESGVQESDGINSSGAEFGQISGVAPHANIIAYQICSPGDTGDTYSGCPDSAILAALDDTLIDEVDVINYSISGGGNPWNSSTEIAFLAAQQAGIFSSISSGNSGPAANTSAKSAPWYTVVGASTHGRTINYTLSFNGSEYRYVNGSGPSATETISASAIAAIDLDPNNEQGCARFDADVFKDAIALIQRGNCNFSDKVDNAAEAGALSVVVYNNVDGNAIITMGALENTTIPAVMISQNSGAALLSDLADNPSLSLTIDTMPTATVTPENADIMASFSSRGPNSYVDDIMTPSVTAPGVSIYAAYSDQQFGHDVTGPAPSDYAFLQGTSMSAPHVAGAAAVLRSAHPTWTPDNIRSALMLTAVTEGVRKEDGVTSADFFDMGAGSIRVNLADQTGLVMNETADNYVAADPELGGDPKTLNIPSASNASCVGACQWTRTVTAAKDGSWSVTGQTISSGLSLSVSPASFTLTAGQSQTITINADSVQAESNVWSFGHVVMTSSEHPTARIPVSIRALKGNIPESVSFNTNRDADNGLVSDVTALEITDFTARSYGLTKADKTEATLALDSDNSSSYDDVNDGINTTLYTVPENAKRFVAEIITSDSPDLDLRVGIDSNGDGIAQEDEEIAISATATALEKINIMSPEAGSYWVTVQNWAASAAGAEDAYTLATAIVDGEQADNLSIEADAAVPALTPFNIRFKWSLADASDGDIYFGAVDLGTSADNAGNLGLVAVDLMRGEDDVSLTNNADSLLQAGDSIDFTVSVLANKTPSDRTYTVTAAIPDGMTLDQTSVTGEATITGNEITWTVLQESILGQQPYYSLTTNNDENATCATPFGGYVDLEQSDGLTPDQTITGDNTEAYFATEINFLGTTYQGFTLTDDGYITFSEASASGYLNQLIPDTNSPNNLIAPFWRDMVFRPSDTSGLTVAETDVFVFVEYDDMMHYLVDDEPDLNDTLDFQVIYDKASGNFWFAYDNVTHNAGDLLGVTVGWENASGNNGEANIYAPSIYGGEEVQIDTVETIQSGLVMCYVLNLVDENPKLLQFTAQVDNDFNGVSLNVALTHSTDDENTVTVIDETAAEFQLQGAPTASIAGPTSVTENGSIELDGSGSFDPNDDPLTYTWEQTSGPQVTLTASGAVVTVAAPEVTQNETVTIQLTVDDGNGNTDTDSFSISIINQVTSTPGGGGNTTPDNTDSGGGGSITWLLLMIGSVLLIRRNRYNN